jgi:hypothetical protein
VRAADITIRTLPKVRSAKGAIREVGEPRSGRLVTPSDRLVRIAIEERIFKESGLIESFSGFRGAFEFRRMA